MATKKEAQYALLLDDLTALEEYIHDLFNFSPLPICFISPIGVILELNPAMEKTAGFKIDELIGESIEKVFRKEEIGSLTKDTFREGFVEGREMRFFPKEGSEVAVRISTRIRKDEKGELVGYFLSFFDLTDIKRTEGELKRVQTALLNILEDTEEARRRAEDERNKTQAIITNFTDGLFFFDRGGGVILMNPQAERFFHVEKEKTLGRPVQEIKKSPELQSLIDFLGGETEEISRKEFTLSENLILEVSAILMRRDGVDSGRLVVLHDVTRDKIVERLKTEFVSLAAHQLRTPLSAIKWSLKMLLDGDLGRVNRSQKEILKKTYQSNERMIALINDLLSLARIEEGKYVINPALVDIIEICQRVTDVTDENFKRKGIRFAFSPPDKKTLQVFGDEEKLSLVIQNLIDNAIKYTPKGGSISLSLRATKDEVKIEVKDNGIGIGKEEQGRVFSKFFRTKEAVLAEPAGTGLGLYMAKNIIDSHGGKIWFESEIGRGSAFYLTLPRRKAD